MSWTQRFFGQSLPDPPPRDPTNPFWWGERSQVATSGVVVNEDTAMRISAVFAAVSVISSAIAGLPLITYIRAADGKHRNPANPVYDLLRTMPNDAQTAFEFKEYMQACMLLWGNGYSEILPGPRGFVDQLDVPFHPRNVRPKIDKKARRILYYEITEDDGSQRRIAPEQMFHVRGLSLDGLIGVSVLTYARETFGISLAAEGYGSRFFSQDATPATVLTHPGELSGPAAARIRAEWQMLHSGLRNAHSTAVLEEGMTVNTIGMSNEDAQFIQTRQFGIREVARWFQIQPHMIQDLMNATFTNIEQQGLEFVTYTLGRWINRWEQRASAQLIFDPNQFAEFLVDALLRGDTLTRYQAYHLARADGWMNGNEIRSKENMNSVPGLDSYDPVLTRRETITDATTKPPSADAAMNLPVYVGSNGHARD